MGDIDQAFGAAFQATRAQMMEDDAKEDPEVAKKARNKAVREDKTPMDKSNAVARIGLAFNDKDYFRCLQLPGVGLDELDRPKWEVTPGEIARAFRLVSRFVHPDKNPGNAACKEAFEQLNESYRILLDPELKGEAVRKAGERLANKLAGFAAPTTTDVVEAAKEMGARLEKKAAKAKEEANDFAETIKQQQLDMRERMKRKREAQARAREREAEAEGKGSDSDSSDDGRRKKGAAGRGGRGRGRRPGFKF